MNNLFKILLLAIISFDLSCQNEFFNNGSSIAVQSGGLIFVQGEVINTDNGVNIGLINNSGTIALSGDWTNNSTTSALTSTTGLVELNGALQLITGTTSTTFNNLTLLGSNTKRLNINTFVGGITGVLNLTSRPLDLNSNTLFVTNALQSAIIRTTGYILSETPATPGYGIIQWNLGNNTGNYEFPFGTNTASYIPVFYNISGAGSQAGVGSISASTYPTTPSLAINNRPLPTGVADLINNCGTEHAKKMLDRFWVINANNYVTTPTVIKKLTYVDDEWNAVAASTNSITETLLKTWYHATSGWVPITSSNNSVLNEQTVPTNTNYGVFTLGEYKQLSITLLNIDSVKCFGQNNGVIQFSSTVGYDANSYNWNSVISTDTIKSNLIAGTYTIIATDGMGCSDTINNISVFEPVLLTQSLTANDFSFCRNQPLQLTSNYNGGTKPYVLNWSTGATSSNLTNNTSALVLTPTVSGQYITVLTDKNNCVSSDTVYININQLPVVNFDALVKQGCQPLLVQFTNQSGNNPKINSYQWNFGQGNNSNVNAPTFVFNNPGSYNITLVATSDSGCVNSKVKNDFITVYEKPTANFIYAPTNDADLLNPKIDFQNASGGNYTNSSWSFGDGATTSQTNPTHLYNDIGFFNVTLIVINLNNCVDSITKIVEIKEVPVIYVPNTFTPLNSDGLNDIFTVKGVNFNEFNMMIFDRWGEKIHETTDPYQGWDGKYKGQDCKSDTYIYKISYKFIYGNQRGVAKTLTGHVTLLN
ncbi:MAG: gliding motility-associated C-terminal domain-containing protein [Bacteroidetes bacterium]|nr:gliding motility-associated C-terminal domain-containing protein [Bacteroidota bacterium]